MEREREKKIRRERENTTNMRNNDDVAVCDARKAEKEKYAQKTRCFKVGQFYIYAFLAKCQFFCLTAFVLLTTNKWQISISVVTFY